MSDASRYIRLAGAVTAAVSSYAFVSAYSWASKELMRVESMGTALPVVAEVLANYAGYAFIIPLLFLFTGIWAARRSGSAATFELSVTAAWVFAFSWLAYALWVWRLAQIPEFHVHAQ